MRGIIDRYDGGLSECQGETKDFPKSKVPTEAKPGDDVISLATRYVFKMKKHKHCEKRMNN